MKIFKRIVEIISGALSLIALGFNIYFAAEFARLSRIELPPDAEMGESLGHGLSQAIILIFLIVGLIAMAVLAFPRWLAYTIPSAKRRGAKAFLFQLPFFVVFAALFAFLYTQITSQVEIQGIILSAVIGGLGFGFMFADIDLYKAIFRIGKKTPAPVAEEAALTEEALLSEMYQNANDNEEDDDEDEADEDDADQEDIADDVDNERSDAE